MRQRPATVANAAQRLSHGRGRPVRPKPQQEPGGSSRMNAAVGAQPGFPLVGGSLALLQIPFVFTQDDVLNTDEFLRKAKERGHNVSLEGLQRLHSRRLLL